MDIPLKPLAFSIRVLVPRRIWRGAQPGDVAGDLDVLTLVVAALCAVLAVWTYRLKRIGWWGSTSLMAILGLSTGLTLRRVGTGEVFAALGHAELSIDPSTDGWLLGLTLLLTLASLIYMAGIKHHFSG